MRLNMPTKASNYDNFSPLGIYKGTREEWLEDAARIMGDWLNELITPQDIKNHNKNRIVKNKVLERFKLSDCRFRCGITSSRKDYRMKHYTAGQIHYKQSTGNNVHEIVISNRLNGKGKKSESTHIGHILLHEMIHSCTHGHGHKGEFKRLARGVGMTGKLTMTENGEELEERIKINVVDVLGKFPHKAVISITSKKGSRLLKITCSECDIIMRASAKACNKLIDMECPACQNSDYVHNQGYLVVEGV